MSRRGRGERGERLELLLGATWQNMYSPIDKTTILIRASCIVIL